MNARDDTPRTTRTPRDSHGALSRQPPPPQDRLAAVGGSWRRLYVAGGVAAVVYVVLVLVPIVLVFVAPVPPVEGRAVLDFIAAHQALYLAELVCFVGLAVPALVVFAALAVAVWPVDKSIAALGGLFGIASEIIALALGSSPQSLHGGLVVLSNAYVQAGDETRRAGLVSAADALIAATNAVSWAGILTAAGILVLSLLMRRRGFGTAVAAQSNRRGEPMPGRVAASARVTTREPWRIVDEPQAHQARTVVRVPTLRLTRAARRPADTPGCSTLGAAAAPFLLR
jgi:hypothetical protein